MFKPLTNWVLSSISSRDMNRLRIRRKESSDECLLCQTFIYSTRLLSVYFVPGMRDKAIKKPLTSFYLHDYFHEPLNICGIWSRW